MTDTDPGTGSETGAVSKTDLAEMKTEILDAVKGMISSLTGHAAPAPATGSGQPQDLQAQIDAAVAKVNADRDQADKDAAHAAEHEQMKAAAAETPPMERKRSHRIMGWGEPAK